MRSLIRTLCASLLVCVVGGTGCTSPLVAVRHQSHPKGGQYLVSATIDEWPGGFYSAAITIRNRSTKTLRLQPGDFRLEGTPPTGFVAAGPMVLFFGEQGYQMPEAIAANSSVQGEVFFEIRGTSVPHGPVRLFVNLPDGEHSFEFDLLQ
ncbi:MAG: hypothetical protein JNL90_20330 [Planctomycetes bacterium]|nr:hypothetical protein [Planctomycetota bacterium]